jgi:hypothetical protein
MALIQRGKLGANGQPDDGDDANGKNERAKICSYSFNAIERRLALPRLREGASTGTWGATSKNVVPTNHAVSADCNPTIQPRQSCGDMP